MGQNCGHGFHLVLSLKTWRAPWPPSGFSDPILRNPLFWLTWLAVMTAIVLCGIVVGVLTRTALAFGRAQLRKAMAREAVGGSCD